MIISHRYRFIFIKTKKTAGTSIELELAPHCGPDDILTPVNPPVEGHRRQNDTGLWFPARELMEAVSRRDFRACRNRLGNLRTGQKFFSHIPAELVRLRVPKKVWNCYYKFCVDREPIDKTLSHYYHRKARGKVADFDAYMKAGNYCHNMPLYTDHRGDVVVDRVLRFENLSTELGEVLKQLGIPHSGEIKARAKSQYRDRTEAPEVMLKEHKTQLEVIFKNEIIYNGYAVSETDD